jgi:ankyrin repeat protein
LSNLYFFSRNRNAELLLANGAYINARDVDKATALMDAAWAGHLHIVKQFLEKKAEINATDAEGRTALQYAKSGNNKEIVHLLLAHGAEE